MLDNINWWIELGLQPLWNPIADEINRVLKEINPFPSILKDWPATVVCNSETKVPLSKLQDGWLSLSLSDLRFLRAERKFTEFEDWSNRLEDVTIDWLHHRQRLFGPSGF